jgi:hypothetical protein
MLLVLVMVTYWALLNVMVTVWKLVGLSVFAITVAAATTVPSAAVIAVEKKKAITT